MITQIRITNFQCHRDLTLDLGRSTILQGGSDHGKTAVLRALYWVFYNEPRGTDYVSTWACKKTSQGITFHPGEYTEVMVVVDGHTITRLRSNEFNGYILDGVKYEALRGDVPAEITAALNISEVSVQKQLDPPFLLSMTPGEAATFLNKLANLEDVSGILATSKKTSADATAAAEAAAANAQAAIEAEAKFDWVDEAQALMAKCEETAEALGSLRENLTKIGMTVEDYNVTQRELHPLDHALRVLPTPVNNDPLIRECREGITTLRAYRDADQEDAVMSALLANLSALGNYPQAPDTGRSRLEKTLSDFDSIEPVAPLAEAASKIEQLRDSIKAAHPDFHLTLDAPATYDRSALQRLQALLADFDSLDDLDRLTEAEQKLNALPQPPSCYTSYVGSLENSLQIYDSLEDPAAIDADIAELVKSLEGQVCPTCGRPFEQH